MITFYVSTVMIDVWFLGVYNEKDDIFSKNMGLVCLIKVTGSVRKICMILLVYSKYDAFL